MAMGMDFLISSIMDSLDDNTKAAINAVPQNVKFIAESLKTIDARLNELAAIKLCGRLAEIEETAKALEEVSERIEEAQKTMLRKLEKIEAHIDPSWTPDIPLPSLAEVMHEPEALPAPDPTEPESNPLQPSPLLQNQFSDTES